MTRFIRQIITVAAVAVVSCDFNACADAESNELVTSRGVESEHVPPVMRLRSRDNRRKLSTKSNKSSKSNGLRNFGTKSSKKSRDDGTSGRVVMPDRKDRPEEERDPEEDLNEIINNIRAIVPERKPTIGLPNNDIATGTSEEADPEQVESPNNFETTEESDLPFLIKVVESEDEPMNEAFSNPDNKPSGEDGPEDMESGNDGVENPTSSETTEESDLPFLIEVVEAEDEPMNDTSESSNNEPSGQDEPEETESGNDTIENPTSSEITEESDIPVLVKVVESEDESLNEFFSNPDNEPRWEDGPEDMESGNDGVGNPTSSEITEESDIPVLVKVVESEDESMNDTLKNSKNEPSRENTPENNEPENDSAESSNVEVTEESDLPFLVTVVESEDDPVDETSSDPNNESNNDFDFSVVRIEDTGHADENTNTITIEVPRNEPTESPTESNSEVNTEHLVVQTSSRFEKETRTVQIVHPENENECMTYDFALDEMAIYMGECSTSGIATARTWQQRKDDHWEILRISGAENNFQLRHKSTRLCIPANSDRPGHPFDCIQYFGMGDAIADSFRGLVNCISPHAAVFEVDNISNSLYMSNSGCQDESFIDPVPVLMTYKKEELTGERTAVVWGGRILLELQEGLEEFNFNNEWKFVDV